MLQNKANLAVWGPDVCSNFFALYVGDGVAKRVPRRGKEMVRIIKNYPALAKYYGFQHRTTMTTHTPLTKRVEAHPLN